LVAIGRYVVFMITCDVELHGRCTIAKIAKRMAYSKLTEPERAEFLDWLSRHG
jgi:hypothetical protein